MTTKKELIDQYIELFNTICATRMTLETIIEHLRPRPIRTPDDAMSIENALRIEAEHTKKAIELAEVHIINNIDLLTQQQQEEE